MGFTLNSVVPWGRNFEEYLSMFALSATDLKKNIIGIGDGPASFNSTLTKLGGNVISVDPIYQFSGKQIKSRIDITYADVMEQMRANKDKYIWKNIQSLEDLGNVRMSAMSDFLADYEADNKKERYIFGDAINLPFANDSFELALASHFLFLYSLHLDKDFHIQSINEALRVANEIRIFPLLTLDSKKSPHVEDVMKHFIGIGCRAKILDVDYEFQVGGSQMLVISR